MKLNGDFFMENNNRPNGTVVRGGTGFIGLLTLLFIALKLTSAISWSWWWVLSPLWISAVGIAGFIGIIVLIVKNLK